MPLVLVLAAPPWVAVTSRAGAVMLSAVTPLLVRLMNTVGEGVAAWLLGPQGQAEESGGEVGAAVAVVVGEGIGQFRLSVQVGAHGEHSPP